MFKKADHDRIIQIAKEAIEREGKVHAFIILKDSKDGRGAERLGRRELYDGESTHRANGYVGEKPNHISLLDHLLTRK